MPRHTTTRIVLLICFVVFCLEATTISLFTVSPSAAPQSSDDSAAPSSAEFVTAQNALQMQAQSMRIIQGADTLVQSPSTVVTGYFTAPSKHSTSEYNTWMANMLSTLDPLVVFTEREMVDTILSLRKHALNATVIVEMLLSDLPIAHLNSPQFPSPDLFWQHELDLDPERNIHQSYQLFWIWLSKSWWVTQAIHHNFFESTFYMYTDIGCYRDSHFNGKTIIQHTEMIPKGAIAWSAHQIIRQPPTRLWSNKVGAMRHFYHSGAQAAGTADAWLSYHHEFSKTIDAFIEQDFFIGEDQMVLQSTCLMRPDMCVYVPGYQSKDNAYFALRSVLHSGSPAHLLHVT